MPYALLVVYLYDEIYYVPFIYWMIHIYYYTKLNVSWNCNLAHDQENKIFHIYLEEKILDDTFKSVHLQFI